MESDENPVEYPTAAQVFDDVGDKVVGAFASSVKGAKADLATYRSDHPTWVAQHSERGLANWINDRLWAHLGEQLDDVTAASLFEKGPTREVIIGINYRFRLKRHDDMGRIASYNTPTFLEFVSQDQPQSVLEGFEETRLVAGYVWIKDERAMGDGVVSLRDGKDNVIWQEVLPDVDDVEGGGTVTTPESDGPKQPDIDIRGELGQEAAEAPEGP